MNKIESRQKVRKLLNDHKKLVSKIQKSNKHEVKNIKDSHTGRLLFLEEKNHQSLLDARLKGEKHLLAQIDSNERKLKEVSDNLTKTENALNTQEEMAIDQHEHKMLAFGDRAEAQYQKRHEETEAFTSKINEKAFQDRIDIKNDAEHANLEQKLRAKTLLEQTKFDYQQRIDQARKQSAKKLKLRENDIKVKEEEQRVAVANEQIRMRQKYSRDLMMLEKSQQMHLDHEKTVSDYNLKETRKRLQAKIHGLKSQHEVAIENQNARAKSAMNNLRKNYSKDRLTMVNRLEDPFYSILTIDPQISDLGSEYELRLKIPPYEKDLVSLNAFKRTLRLTVARNYNSKTRHENGTENRTNRSETVTKEFRVDDILDNTKVGNRYENGVLIYTIAKA